ncbi:hypothetical protein K439DRAFT_869395 [Ramaria rubella]|nr:hypothetical protein K439DRAFT_869395 [Ramaria rubella]
MFIYVFVVCMAFTIVQGHPAIKHPRERMSHSAHHDDLARQFLPTFALLITPPSNCSAIMDQDRCPTCRCTYESMFLLEQRTICILQNSSELRMSDDAIAEAVHYTLEVANWCHGDPTQFEPHRPRMQQAVFLSLQITGGHVGLVLLVIISLLVRTIRRDLVFFNFCITLIVSSAIFSLALYQDISKHTTDFPLSPKWYPFTPDNSFRHKSLNTCGIQAALINGVQPMTAFSTFALIYKLWLDLHTSIHGTYIKPQWIAPMKALMLILPYVFLVTIFIISLFHVLQDFPSTSAFYCLAVGNPILIQTVVSLATVFLVLALPFDVLLFKMMYSHWSTFRRPSENRVISISIIVRVVFFSVYRMTLALADTLTLTTSNVIPGRNSIETPMSIDIFQATLPLVAFLVLGTTKENLAAVGAILFWYKKSPSRYGHELRRTWRLLYKALTSSFLNIAAAVSCPDFDVY